MCIRDRIHTDRNEVRLIEQNIACHQHRIGEQAAVDVVRMLGALVLELRHAAHFAHVGVAVEQPVHLRVLVNVALEKEHVLFRIEADGQQKCQQMDGLRRCV